MCWRGLETEAPIKRIGLGIDGVGKQRPDARLIGNTDRTHDGVLQQTKTQPTSLVVRVHRKPGQNDQWNRILPHAASNPLRRFQRVDLTYGQTVVPSDAILLTDYERACRAAGLRLASMMEQPLRQRRFAAVELVQAVR